jgi:hypothetical protein
MNEAEGSSPLGQTDSNPCFDFTHLDWTRDVRGQTNTTSLYTDKKGNETYILGSVAKSYTRKGFLIYEEINHL